MSEWKKHDCLEWRTEGIGCAHCADMVLAGQEVGAAYDEGQAMGRAEILRRVAQLPKPEIKAFFPTRWICEWCGGMNEHDNGCLWPEATKAAQDSK